jgi:hypothetical protein
MKDINGNALVVGDYVWLPLYKFPSKIFGQIVQLNDVWCIDQWVAIILIKSGSKKFNTREDCDQLRKIPDEEAMLLILEN